MILDQLQFDLIQAMLDKDDLKTATLRLLISEAKYAQISKGQLTDNDIIAVIQKEIKKRNESVQAYKSANRLELAEKEQKESDVLSAYLPEQLSDSELTKIIEAVITEVEAKNIQDMGKVIAAVRSRVGAKADGAKISLLVKQLLLG